MTNYQQRLAELLLGAVGELPPRAAVEKLLTDGLIDIGACERLAIYREIRRLQQLGIPRCDAIRHVAGAFCCSYEKARNAFYREAHKA